MLAKLPLNYFVGYPEKMKNWFCWPLTLPSAPQSDGGQNFHVTNPWSMTRYFKMLLFQLNLCWMFLIPRGQILMFLVTPWPFRNLFTRNLRRELLSPILLEPSLPASYYKANNLCLCVYVCPHISRTVHPICFILGGSVTKELKSC